MRVVLPARTAAIRCAAMPSVMVGRTATPVALICGRTVSRFAAYDAGVMADDEPFQVAEYQNGEMSLNRSTLSRSEVRADADVLEK